MTDATMLGACGLDCGACEIRLAPAEPAAAEIVLEWFRQQNWLSADEGMAQVLERKMYCTGCLGDRNTHWSADCWILACCVSEHGLSNCSECPDFACARLVDWAKQNDSYAAALARLQALR